MLIYLPSPAITSVKKMTNTKGKEKRKKKQQMNSTLGVISLKHVQIKHILHEIAQIKKRGHIDNFILINVVIKI
jgi:hypothetical protein